MGSRPRMCPHCEDVEHLDICFDAQLPYLVAYVCPRCRAVTDCRIPKKEIPSHIANFLQQVRLIAEVKK